LSTSVWQILGNNRFALPERCHADSSITAAVLLPANDVRRVVSLGKRSRERPSRGLARRRIRIAEPKAFQAVYTDGITAYWRSRRSAGRPRSVREATFPSPHL